MSYLLVDKDKKFDEEKASELWKEIYEEYCKLSDDTESLIYFSVYTELMYLETRYFIATTVIKRLVECIDMPKVVEVFIKVLGDWKYRINPKKPLNDEIEKIINNIKVSENKIRLKKDELDKLKKEGGEKATSLISQVVNLEQALTRNEIDPKKTSVEKWINLINKVKEINKQQKKAQSKYKR